MEFLNIITNNKNLFIILAVILLINLGVIIYLVLKERQADKKEINELLNDLNPKEDEIKKQDEKLEKNKKEVEDMLLKMQKDLETKPEDVVSNFENEQEEKSIISYQELLNSVKEKKEVEEKVIPIKIELDNNTKDDNESVIDKEELSKNFKNTDFISPIFGKQNNKIKYPTVPKLDDNSSIVDEFDLEIKESKERKLESIIDTSKLENEMLKNDAFLKALKEFRKNLN